MGPPVEDLNPGCCQGTIIGRWSDRDPQQAIPQGSSGCGPSTPAYRPSLRMTGSLQRAICHHACVEVLGTLSQACCHVPQRSVTLSPSTIAHPRSLGVTAFLYLSLIH